MPTSGLGAVARKGEAFLACRAALARAGWRRYGAAMTFRHLLLLAPVSLIAACHQGHGSGADVPGDAGSTAPFAAIAPTDVVRFTGTEPFWGGDVTGDLLTWTTPERIDGVKARVTRFAGRGGMGFTGTLDGRAFTMTVTQAQCSDGMSDRAYPFTVSVQLGQDALLTGCGWTSAKPFSGGE